MHLLLTAVPLCCCTAVPCCSRVLLSPTTIPLFPDLPMHPALLMYRVTAVPCCVRCAYGSYTGDAFVRSALMGRAATVHIRAGEGDGALPACLARGLGVEFMTTKLQVNKTPIFLMQTPRRHRQPSPQPHTNMYVGHVVMCSPGKSRFRRYFGHGSGSCGKAPIYVAWR